VAELAKDSERSNPLSAPHLATQRLGRGRESAHPSAAWTLQQLRETIPSEHQYRFIIHDRDAISSADFDESLAGLGLVVIKTPPRSPQANALCERVIGTLRRECMDWIIPLSEGHLRQTLSAWMVHYNRGPATFLLGARYPRTVIEPADTFATPSASIRPTKLGGRALGLERTSPRVPPDSARCVTVHVSFAGHSDQERTPRPATWFAR
jgi:hypothetical protein